MNRQVSIRFDFLSDQSGLTRLVPLLTLSVALFRKTTFRNKELEARVEELEREVGVWKRALKAADDDQSVLQRKVTKLERSIGSLKVRPPHNDLGAADLTIHLAQEDNPLILCLIDGDGNIFASELITMGTSGGRRAAMLLTQGLTEHLASLDSAAAGRGEIWLTIYCNKKGLMETLTTNQICTAEQFEQFIMGFNQAAPLFSFVDAGIGKEAADSKIKGTLVILPQRKAL